MKVIGFSNFGDESVADYLVKDNLTEEEAQKLCEEEQKKAGSNSHYWYKVVPDDHRLWRGMADLVGDV